MVSISVEALILEKMPVWVPVEVNVRVLAEELYVNIAVKGSMASGVLTVTEVNGTDNTVTPVVQLTQPDAVVIVEPAVDPTVKVIVEALPGRADKTISASTPKPEF